MATKETQWEIARAAKTTGMRVTLELDPTQITTRIKNAIKRQLRQGRVTGGWRSQSRAIAEHLATKFKLPVVRDSWRGMRVPYANSEQRSALAELVRADFAAKMLEQQHYSNSYYKDRQRNELETLADPERRDFFLSFYYVQNADAARKVMAESMTEHEKFLIEQALKHLDGTETIHITTYH